MSAAPTTPAATGRKKIAQDKERNDAALGRESKNTSSPQGAKEITSLPVGWTLKTVGELAAKEPNSITDGPFGSKLKTEHYTRSGPRVIRLTNIGDGEFVDAHAHISDGHFSTLQKHRIFSGDIVIAALGEKLPRACLIPDTIGPAIVKADCIRFKPSDEHSPKFLNYALNWEGTQKRTASIVHGVGRPRLNLSEIKSILLPIVPLPEQRRIVAEIEKQFTRLEAGVAALRRVQANLKRYRAAVLKAACEGKLVPTEAELTTKNAKSTKPKPFSFSASSVISAVKTPAYETGAELLTRILTERRQTWLARRSLDEGGQGRGKNKEPVAPDAANLPPQLPEGWACASVDQITENFDGRRVPLKSADRDKRSGQYPYYGASGVIDDIDDFLFDGEYLLIAEDGANLLSRSTPIAFKATGRFWVNNHAHIVQTRGGVPLTYLSVFLNGKDISFLVTGSAQPKLTQAALNKIPVPLPPLAEQTRIVAEVERRLSVVEELESVVSANLQRAVRLRQSILQKAFTGQL